MNVNWFIPLEEYENTKTIKCFHFFCFYKKHWQTAVIVLFGIWFVGELATGSLHVT